MVIALLFWWCIDVFIGPGVALDRGELKYKNIFPPKNLKTRKRSCGQADQKVDSRWTLMIRQVDRIPL